jgi:hypothetical protein
MTALRQVEVRVVLRGGRPCLDPPVEELRLRHYSEHLGSFLGLPAKMKVGGVWGEARAQGVGVGMGAAYPKLLYVVYLQGPSQPYDAASSTAA